MQILTKKRKYHLQSKLLYIRCITGVNHQEDFLSYVEEVMWKSYYLVVPARSCEQKEQGNTHHPLAASPPLYSHAQILQNIQRGVPVQIVPLLQWLVLITAWLNSSGPKSIMKRERAFWYIQLVMQHVGGMIDSTASVRIRFVGSFSKNTVCIWS